MAIKYERPSPRRMMLHFDRKYLDMLPVFKRGFRAHGSKGNELALLKKELLSFDDKTDLDILDIGSADGEWLGKTMEVIWNAFERNIRITALEPIDDNATLAKVCRDRDITWVKTRIEESELPAESFDVIMSTHSAYYYFNQPLAHEEMFRLLKPGGKLIVTLVSQFCVLNSLTTWLLEPHRQFGLNAESYLAMVAKLGLFSIDRVVSFNGGVIDAQFYEASEDHLRALQYVLARHRLTTADLEQSLKPFRSAVQVRHHMDRINLIMIFDKARMDLLGQIHRSRSGAPRLEIAIGLVRSACEAMVHQVAVDKRVLLEGDTDTFSTEALSEKPRLEFLDAIAVRLTQAAIEASWEDTNHLKQLIDSVISMVGPSRQLDTRA